MKSGSILLFGGTGQIGSAIADISDSPLTAPGRAVCDLRRDDPHPLILSEGPALVINAAALTDVDRAETEPDLALRLNREAPERMAKACAELSIPLIHLSTDYVFGGEPSERPFTEESAPAPVNVYGQSKRAGEEAVLAAGCQAFILRTAWVYSAAGNGFLSRLLAPHRLAGPLHVETEQISSPSWAAEVANAVMRIAALILSDPQRAENIAGVYHLAGGGAASRYEFAEEVYAWLRTHQPSLALPSLCAAPSVSFDAPARRPRFTALDSSRAKDRLGVAMPDWRVQLHACLEALYT